MRASSPSSASSGALPIAAMILAVVSWGLANILVKQMSIDGLNVAFYRLWFGTALTFVR